MRLAFHIDVDLGVQPFFSIIQEMNTVFNGKFHLGPFPSQRSDYVTFVSLFLPPIIAAFFFIEPPTVCHSLFLGKHPAGRFCPNIMGNHVFLLIFLVFSYCPYFHELSLHI